MTASRKTPGSYIGLAGVADDELPRARRWGRWLEWPMLLLVLWILVEWYLLAESFYPQSWARTTNWVIWLFFLFETAFLTTLVRDKRRYLLTNWINLVIIILGLPLFWNDAPMTGLLRGLRLLLMAGLLLEMSGTVRQVLSRNHLGLTLFVSLILIIMAGMAIAAVDPGIDTPWEGIWWAWVTVTTVGYGDVVPESPRGKVFGAILMLMGIALFALLTASFSAFFISREEEGVLEREEAFIKDEKTLLERERRAIDRLEGIEQRLARLEDGLQQLLDRNTPDSTAKDHTPGDPPD